jgi:hypothetical protein
MEHRHEVSPTSSQFPKINYMKKLQGGIPAFGPEGFFGKNSANVFFKQAIQL